MNEPVYDIRFQERNEIDTVKWDHCIQNASNGLIYARSFYLDAMAKNWSALVEGDYQNVMPLTWNKKYGFAYLYQPAFTAQLGVFFTGSEDSLILEKFVERTQMQFKFCEIFLNFANKVPGATDHDNYVLNLDKTYPEIRNSYKKRLLENLREAGSYHLNYLDSTDYPGTIHLFKSQYGNRFPHVKRTDYLHFEKLCTELTRNKMIFARQVKDSSGSLLNSSIFFRDERRIYNIMSVSLPAGREKRAHFFLLDHLIMEFAGQHLILDLEGSELPGVAEFYRKFGTVNHPYSFLKYNHLPFPFRLFK
jgi:hypothetical protein